MPETPTDRRHTDAKATFPTAHFEGHDDVHNAVLYRNDRRH